MKSTNPSEILFPSLLGVWIEEAIPLNRPDPLLILIEIGFGDSPGELVTLS